MTRRLIAEVFYDDLEGTVEVYFGSFYKSYHLIERLDILNDIGFDVHQMYQLEIESVVSDVVASGGVDE